MVLRFSLLLKKTSLEFDSSSTELGVTSTALELGTSDFVTKLAAEFETEFEAISDSALASCALLAPLDPDVSDISLKITLLHNFSLFLVKFIDLTIEQ